jgi:DNA-directed RNA polymerase sigma subunit (sigma70/sigma32)
MKSKARSLAARRWRMNVAQEVEVVLRQLTPHEEQVLRLCFGIGKRPQEIIDVAVGLSITPTAVHRIGWSALRKLRLAAVTEERSECATAE